MKGGRRQGRQKKRWENNIRQWTGLEFPESSGEERKIEETGCEIICGAQRPSRLRDDVIMNILTEVDRRTAQKEVHKDTDEIPVNRRTDEITEK